MNLRSSSALLGATATLALAAGVMATAGSTSSQASTSGQLAHAAGTKFSNAFYSNWPLVRQAKTPAGMRNYLSADQPQMEMQSQLLFGNLQSFGGRANSFASMIQRQDGLVKGAPGLPIALSTLILNPGNGWLGGVINGVPELTFPMSLTSRPWSARAETVALGKKPQFIDMRVVKGELGKRGSIYEVTANLISEKVGASGGKGARMTAYVRVKDMTGIVMWGFGPSGFKPQWLYPKQRKVIVNRYGGSIERYLRATNDPMSGQGNYYYSSPLLKVEKFTIYRGGKLLRSGRGGYSFFDQCTQSWDANAQKIINKDFGWVSFEIPLPALGGGMVLGRLAQPTVGALPYAALATPRSRRARNGALIAHNWSIKDISLKPVLSSKWKSRASGQTYYMKWTAVLRGGDTAHRGRLTLTAVTKNSEVVFAKRAVYEGLFRYSGTLAGRRVAGTTFAEMQPEGTM